MAKTIPLWYRTILAAATAFLSLVPLSTALAGAPGSTTQPEVAPTASGFDNNMTGDWWGLRQRLQAAGITVGATVLLEGFGNFQGGIDAAHAVGATTFDLNLALDTTNCFTGRAASSM